MTQSSIVKETLRMKLNLLLTKKTDLFLTWSRQPEGISETMFRSKHLGMHALTPPYSFLKRKPIPLITAGIPMIFDQIGDEVTI